MLSTPPAFNLSQNQTLQFKSVQRFLLGRNQNLKVLFPTRSSLVNEPEKEFFTLRRVLRRFVKILFCRQLVNNFLRNLQKTFYEGFLKPRCHKRRGRLLRSFPRACQQPLRIFPKFFFRRPSRLCCFQAANAMSTLSSPGCQQFSG